MPDLDFVNTLLASLATSGVAGGTWIGRKFWVGAKRVCVFLKAEYDAILQDRKTLAEIAKELKPNGGSSLRDLGDRLERRQLILEHKVVMLLQDVDEAHFEADKTGKCVAVNAACLKLTQTSLDDVLANDWMMGVHPDDLDRVVKGWQDAVKQSRQFRMTYRFIDPKTGEPIPVTCHSTPMLDSLGQVVGFMGTLSPGGNYDLRTKEEVWAAGLNDQSKHIPAIFDSTSLVAGLKSDSDVALPDPD